MLINKTNAPKIGDVVSVRLVSGDELVGKLVDNTPESVVLSRPISAVMQPTGRGEIGLAFAPFMASASDISEVTLPIGSVLCRPVATRDDVAKGYSQAVSPILQPNNDLLLPR